MKVFLAIALLLTPLPASAQDSPSSADYIAAIAELQWQVANLSERALRLAVDKAAALRKIEVLEKTATPKPESAE